MEVEYWYRYHNRYGSDTPTLSKFRVIKHTPRGVWILDAFDFFGPPVDDPLEYMESAYKRFVLKDARKRYACPTEIEAIDSFLARKNRQVKILQSQIDYTNYAIIAGERIKAKIQTDLKI